MNGVKNLTVGSPAKLIFLFSLPLMVGNVFQQLYTVVDTMVVGQVLGVHALAALGSVDWFNWMSLGLIQGFAQGFSILMAQRFGAQDYKGLRKSIGNSLVMALILAVIFVVVLQILVGPMLNILQIPLEIRPLSSFYLRIIFGGVPIVMAYNIFASILRSLGDSRSPLVAMILAAFINVGLDVLFVVVLHRGVGGAAVATLIAQAISAVYCVIKMVKIEIIRLSRDDFRLDGQLAKRLFLLGVPMAFQNTLIAIGGIIVQSAVDTFGVTFMASYTATNKLYGVLEIAATSYGYAMVTYVGQNLGAGLIDRIRRGIRASVLISLGTSVIIGAVMIIFGKNILMLFISGDAAQVEEVLRFAYIYLVIMSGCLPILYVLHVVRSSIQGMGNTFLPMISGFAELVVRVAGAALSLMIFGKIGFFAMEVMAWVAADVVLIPSWIHVLRKETRRLREEEALSHNE